MRNRDRIESADARPDTMVRMGMVYRTWDKMDPPPTEALLDHGSALLANIDRLWARLRLVPQRPAPRR
ncbi:MAG: hypothetical protein R2818_13375 [Flavobacteriales bacterium]